MIKALTRVLLAAFLLAGGTGCSSTSSGPIFTGEVADSIFFGTAMPGGGAVTPEQWQDFVSKEVTPRYPHSMTAWHASGQWLTENGVLQREKTYVLYLVHPGSPDDERKIREIMDAYRESFHQEAVMQVSSDVSVYLDEGSPKSN